MGLMDNLKDTAGSLLGGQNSGIVNAVLQMFTHNEHGGLGGLIQSFQSKGMGDIVSSWISKGENKPISKEQLKEGLGENRIQDIATKSGQAPDTVVSKLTEVLPDVVNKLTPNGDIPQDNVLQQGISFLKSKL